LRPSTFGVDSGYIQADVIALARILTGWTLARSNLRLGTGDAFMLFTARSAAAWGLFCALSVERGNPVLPVFQQCRLLAVSRSAVYRTPVEVGEEDCAIMALIAMVFIIGRLATIRGLVGSWMSMMDTVSLPGGWLTVLPASSSYGPAVNS